MWNPQKLLRTRFSRFLTVGAGNTAINFLVLNAAFGIFHFNKLASIITATGCAILFSFICNRQFVFKDKSQPAKKFLLFTTVASIGTLVVQSTVYELFLYLLGKQSNVTNDVAQINISNIIASSCVMLWNYNGYRLFVFKKTKPDDAELSSTSEPA